MGEPLVCPGCGWSDPLTKRPEIEVEPERHDRRIQSDLPHATPEELWPDAREAARDDAGY